MKRIGPSPTDVTLRDVRARAERIGRFSKAHARPAAMFALDLVMWTAFAYFVGNVITELRK